MTCQQSHAQPQQTQQLHQWFLIHIYSNRNPDLLEGPNSVMEFKTKGKTQESL